MTKLYLCFIITGYIFSSRSSGLKYIPQLLVIFLAFMAFSGSTGTTRSMRVKYIYRNISFTCIHNCAAFQNVKKNKNKKSKRIISVKWHQKCRKASPSSPSKIYHKLLSHNNRARGLKHCTNWIQVFFYNWSSQQNYSLHFSYYLLPSRRDSKNLLM